MTAFIDAAVFMYAAGPEHPLRHPCQAVILGIGAGTVAAVTSAEVIQEILHRYLSIRQPERGTSIAQDVMDLMGPVLPITHEVMSRVPTLSGRYPGLQARDLVHVATCLEQAIERLVTTDVGMGRVTEVRCISPTELIAHA